MGLSRGAERLVLALGLVLGVGCSDKHDDDVVIGSNPLLDGGAASIDGAVAPASDAQVDGSHAVAMLDGGK